MRISADTQPSNNDACTRDICDVHEQRVWVGLARVKCCGADLPLFAADDHAHAHDSLPFPLHLLNAHNARGTACRYDLIAAPIADAVRKAIAQ
jgi:hypothetical protein